MERTWLIKARGERTCKEVAKALGITESYYWRVEQGIRGSRGLPLDRVIKVAQILGIDPMDAIRQESEWLSSMR